MSASRGGARGPLTHWPSCRQAGCVLYHPRGNRLPTQLVCVCSRTPALCATPAWGEARKDLHAAPGSSLLGSCACLALLCGKPWGTQPIRGDLWPRQAAPLFLCSGPLRNQSPSASYLSPSPQSMLPFTVTWTPVPWRKRCPLPLYHAAGRGRHPCSTYG